MPVTTILRTGAKTMMFRLCCAMLLLLVVGTRCDAQTTAFTFQGKLTDGGSPANGEYDMQFKLYDTPTVGTGLQKGMSFPVNPVTATSGVFTVVLDFGAGAGVFDGADRFLEIGVRPAGSAESYTVLAPRNAITSTPYAIQTINAQQLGGLPASSYVTTSSVGNNFVKNGTTLQSGTNFNIDGKGQIGTTLGIGMAPGVSLALDVAGSARVSPGNGGAMSFGAPNGETGMTLVNGSGRADVRFDGSTLKVLAGAAGVPPPLRNGMTVGQSGQVQMGGDYFPVGPAKVTLVVNNPVNDRAIYARTNSGSVSGNYLPAIQAINDGNGNGLEAISTGGNAIVAYGTLKVTNLASAGSTPLCWNASQQIATCAAIAPPARSLDSQSSLIESQSRRIEALQQRLDEQQQQLATLQRLVCERSPGSDACRE